MTFLLQNQRSGRLRESGHSYILNRVNTSRFNRAFTNSFLLKVTVQFETEGNGQNEIISPMDIS